MSEYTERKTIFKDGEALIEALKDMGFPEVENHIDNPQHLIDYQGKQRPQKADIIVRRRHVPGASNDIGFAKRDDGTFSSIISEYDDNSQDDAWNNKLKVKYQEIGIEKKAAQMGARLVSKKLVGTKWIYEFLKA